MRNAFLTAAVVWCAAFWNIGAAHAQPMTIPSGATVHVRTIDPINAESVQPGSKFRATLAEPLTSANGSVLIPRGAPVQLSVVNVQTSSRVSGRDRIYLRADAITFNGRTYPVVTNVAESKGVKKGHRTLSRTGIGAGAGALIGGIAGGGTGAAVGALVGGGGGTAVAAATGGQHLTIPPESVLSFRLNSPLRLR
jgi:hypothetical protein